MKLYVDENEVTAFVPHIAQIYGHEIALRTADDEHLRGLLDMELFEELQRRGFSGLITRDRMQLRRVDPETGQSEADKLHACGLHWIGHTQPASQGADLVAELAALYLDRWAALAELLPSLKRPSAIMIDRTSRRPVKSFPLVQAKIRIARV